MSASGTFSRRGDLVSTKCNTVNSHQLAMVHRKLQLKELVRIRNAHSGKSLTAALCLALGSFQAVVTGQSLDPPRKTQDMCAYAGGCLCVCVFISLHIHTYIIIHTCIYIYLATHINLYIYTYIHTHSSIWCLKPACVSFSAPAMKPLCPMAQL